MHPFLKCIIAGVAELAIIFALFESVSPVSLNSEPAFTLSDAIFWTFISILAFGFVIYFVQRSAR